MYFQWLLLHYKFNLGIWKFVPQTGQNKTQPARLLSIAILLSGSIQFTHYHFHSCFFSEPSSHSSLQVHPLSPPSPALTSLEMLVELWMWHWAGHWARAVALISTSSTLPPMLPRPLMGKYWMPISHSINWLDLWQTLGTTLQYVVSTVEVRRGGRASPW